MTQFLMILILLISLFLPGAVLADVVHLKNGDRLSGQITGRNEVSITMSTVYSEQVLTIPADVITAIEEDAGTEYEENASPLATSETNSAIEPTEAAPNFDWESKLALNSTFSRGNTDSQTLNFKGSTNFTKDDHRLAMDLSSLHEEEDGDTSKSKDRLYGSYNYLFLPKWFVALESTLDRDSVADIDHRISFNPALGYDVWNEDRISLSLQLGLGYATETVADKSDSTSLFDWRVKYSQKILNGNLELFHKHHIYHNLDGRKNTVLNSSTGARYDLTNSIFTNVQIDYDYDTEPAPGSEKDDLTVLVGVGIRM